MIENVNLTNCKKKAILLKFLFASFRLFTVWFLRVPLLLFNFKQFVSTLSKRQTENNNNNKQQQQTLLERQEFQTNK